MATSSGSTGGPFTPGADRRGHRVAGFTMLEVAFAVMGMLVVIGGAYGLLRSVFGASTETMTNLGTLTELAKTADRLRGDLERCRVIDLDPAGVTLTYTLPLATGDRETLVAADGQIAWGVADRMGERLGGHFVLSFLKTGTLSEVDEGKDINGDGDSTDTFDLGHLIRTSDAGVVQHMRRLPVLLPYGNHGGDVDGDGQPDPLFSSRQNGVVVVRLAQMTREGKLRFRNLTVWPIEN